MAHSIVSSISRIAAFAVALALPQAAAACAQLSENIWMCDRETAWETAAWDPAGDGTTRILGDVTLNFTEEWPGFEIGDDLTTLKERYTTYSEWVAGDGNAPLQVLQSDQLTLEGGIAVRSIQLDALEGKTFMSAVMLAQVGASRIMLYLDAPENTEIEHMEAMSRDVAGMLRDSCADPISCAADYQRPGVAANERG